jgi:hypothetical protein
MPQIPRPVYFTLKMKAKYSSETSVPTYTMSQTWKT